MMPSSINSLSLRKYLPPLITATPAFANPLSSTCSSTSTSASSFPTNISSPDTTSEPHRPFKFGVEFELILRPKAIVSLDPGLTLPGFDASVRQQRNFNLALLKVIASLLSTAGLPCDVYDQNSEDKPDYSRWNATLDGSASKKHMSDGYCILQEQCRRRSTGSPSSERSEYVLGSAQGTTRHRNADRDTLVNYVCPDKYRAWNFLPAKETGHGSIEFRRPPGVVNTKKTKHWIAFTMAFIEMAIRKGPSNAQLSDKRRTRQADFDASLLGTARSIGEYATLDARLYQSDEPTSFHITNMSREQDEWLLRFDNDYAINSQV
ncbi:hypothetical protein NX059_005891 [Plenodomus lindquistii]|nr:hypothetical protein NX059_005891 [Plenodomus lindquistii]